jgi:RNA polymerase sigma factor (sigma-70 family)
MSEDNIDLNSINLIKSGGANRELGLEILYEKYARELRRRFLKKISIPADADDLVQETFIKIVNGCQTYKDNVPLGAWIGRIAKNCLIDFLRSRKNHSLEGFNDEGWEFLESELDKNNGEISVIERDDRASWLMTNHNLDPSIGNDSIEDCVKRGFVKFAKDEPERAEALMLHVDGCDIKKIASLIHRTEGATREYLSQCRKKIEKFLAPCRDYLTS